MRVGDEVKIAEHVRQIRRRKLWSQAELADAAAVSAKTVQRMEAGEIIAGSSRRAVLEALGIDPERPAAGSRRAADGVGEWTPVEDARTLLAQLSGAEHVDVEVDRDGWRAAWRAQPWYRQSIIIATHDPVDRILEIIDDAAAAAELPPGSRARREDDLAKAIRAARTIRWALTSRLDGSGRLSVYIGAPTVDPGATS